MPYRLPNENLAIKVGPGGIVPPKLIDLAVFGGVIPQPVVRGKPRAQMTAPIAPSLQITDTVYFEEPNNPAIRYYLPGYRLAVQRVSGTPHYRVRMAEVDGQWRLEITLEPFAASTLGLVPADVRILTHGLGASLRWEIRNTGGAVREFPMTERLPNADGTVTLAFTLTTLPERDEVYTALTNQEAHAVLVLQRIIHVAVPTNESRGLPRGLGAIIVTPDIFLTKDTLTKASPNVKSVIGRPLRPNPDIIDRPFKPAPGVFVDKPILIDPGWFNKLEPALPTPEIEVTGSELFEANNEPWVRYKLRVKNWQAYSDALFAAAPDLPPCGLNTNAARTWVDIFDSNNQRLYGFCALGRASDLENLWVAVRLTASTPGIYLQLVDRRADLSARSNTVIPPAVILYEEITSTVESREPLFFNPDLHGYIFQGFSQHTATSSGLVAQQVNYDGRWHVYYQDEVQPHRFYYLPDAFKLMRRPDGSHPDGSHPEGSHPEGSHPPLLRLELLAAELEQYRLTYVAMPYLDRDRLEAAEVELERQIPAGHPLPVALEPFQTNAVTFVPSNPLLYQAGMTLSINLNMIQSTVTLSRDDFTTVWDELNGAAALSLGGKIQIAVQGFPVQEFPLTLRLDDTLGELLTITSVLDAVRGGYQLTLRNAIESPLRVNALSGFVQSTTQGLADIRRATWGELALPADLLPPNGEFQAFLLPPADVALNAYLPLVDTDRVQVIPATEALFDAMITSTVREYHHPVTVQVPNGLFNHASGKVAAIQVTFIGGETIVLRPASEPGVTVVSATANVGYPLRDLLLGKPIGNWYQYSVVVAWEDGRVSPPSEPIADQANSFFLRVPQLN